MEEETKQEITENCCGIPARNGKKNIWKYASAVLAVLLLIVIAADKGVFAQGASRQNIAAKSVDFINKNLLTGGAVVSLIDVTEKNNLYLLKLNVDGQMFDSYVSKDGSLLFPSAIDMTKALPTQQPIKSAEVTADDDPSFGLADAPITIIVFSDYQCPYCVRAELTLKQVADTYKDEVRIVFRDFPLGFHQYAQLAAEASECADEQGKFWEYHDLLFAKQPEWSPVGIDKFKEYALDLGLDASQFNACLESGKYADEVGKDLEDGQAAGVTGTPAFFVNGAFVSGAQPFSTFQQIIEQELNKGK